MHLELTVPDARAYAANGQESASLTLAKWLDLGDGPTVFVLGDYAVTMFRTSPDTVELWILAQEHAHRPVPGKPVPADLVAYLLGVLVGDQSEQEMGKLGGAVYF